MSRQSHSKKNVTTIAFLFIIASIGFPFQSITIPTNFGSDYQVVNFFLGNGLVGKSIFDPSTYEQEVVLQAFAEHPTNTTDDIYPMVKRMETAEDTQLSETRHITKLGLPRHVEDNQGNFVANLVNEDENGIQLESGTFSYWFDYSSCSMSIFDVGRIGSITQPIFKSNNWVTKVAVNGTTDWTDVSQNFLPCVVTNDISSSGVIINSTKSDVNGTITEIYKYSKYGGMKTFVSFTNNDPSLTNHMFSFSNILLDVPPSISFVDSVGLNATEKNNFYSQFEGDLQPIVMGGLGTVIPSVNQTTIIHEINRQDFFSDYQFNGTIYSEQITDRFLWIQRVDNAEYRNWDYIFQNPDDFDKLNKIRFVMNPDSTMDTWVDFSNVNTTLGVGETTTIDPDLLTFTNFDHIRLTRGGSLINCNTGGSQSESTAFGISASRTQSTTSPRMTCSLMVLTFDISSIPDDATPIRGTFQNEVTSGSCTTNSIFNWCGFSAPSSILWVDCSGEDLAALPIADKMAATYGVGTSICIDSTWFSSPFRSVGVHADSRTSIFDRFIIEFELFLESGEDTLNMGSTFFFPSMGGGWGGSRSGQTSGAWNITNTFLEVEWEFFSEPSAPENVVCSSDTPTTVLIDWDNPLSTGGRPVTEFIMERDSGAGFTTFQTGLGLFPTEFVDTTVFAGVGFTYRMAAVNGEGTSEFSPATESCGVEGDPTNPVDLVAQNVVLGTVGLNWNPPSFSGNSPITSYKIERTTGTPTGITNGWNWVIHSIDATFTPRGHTVTQTDENIRMDAPSGAIGFDTRGEDILFKTFNVDDIEARELRVLSTHTNTNTQISYQIRLYDGTYSSADINTGGDFPLNSAIVLKGGGLLQSFVTTLSFTEQIQGFVIDTSGATFDGTVTIMIINADSNASSSRFGTTLINSIEIEGYATWDFGNQIITVGVPIKSVKTVDTFFVTSPIGAEQSGAITVQSPNGIIFGDGFISLIEDTGNIFLEFLDDTVAEVTNYGYRIFAINIVGTSPPSNIAVVFTVSAPQPPVITTQPTSTTTINIDWETPDLGGGVLAFYEIERKTGTGGIFFFLDTTTDTEFDDGAGLFALQPSTEYCYRIKTVTGVGDSIFGVESCATTLSPPDKVENLTVIALDGSSVNMSFDDPLSDGGSAITGFQIEQKLGAGAFNIVQLEGSLNQIRNDTGLPIGTLITYRVQAFNQFGASISSSASDTTDATPQTPPNFSCSASSSTSITLNWDTPQTFTAPTGYQIDGRSIGGVFSTIVANTASTDTFFVSGGLPIDTQAEFRVLGITPEGNTDFTPTITCSTLGSPDFPPEDLQGDFTQTIPHQMVLAWDIPDTFGIPIIEFRIERDDGAGYNEIATVSSSTFLFVDQDPANIVAQKYRVFTVGTEGDSAPSIAIPFSANQISHWHYEKTIDDTGDNKNVGAITGITNFNNTGKVGLGMTFDGSTYITVADESDYDFDIDDSFGITTYFKGGGNVGSPTDDWFYIIQKQSATVVAGANCSQSVDDTRCTNGSPAGNQNTYFYKVFDKDSVDGRDLIVEWSFLDTDSFTSQWLVFDGSYSNVDFATDFPTGSNPVIKFNGILNSGTFYSATFGNIIRNELTFDTSNSISTSNEVTLFIRMSDGSGTASGNFIIKNLEIQGFAKWDFGSSTGSTLTPNSPNSCNFACGENNASFTIPSQVLVAKATTLTSTGFKLFIEETGIVALKLTNTDVTNEISVRGTTNVYDDVLHFIGVGYNGDGTASGISIMVDGVFETKTVFFDNLSGSILNNEPLTIGASSDGTSLLDGLLDETRFFGSGTLDDATLLAVAEDSITTVIPIVATITIAGSTFADISSETPLIFMTSGYPLPTISTINLQNFTTTTVNSQTVGLIIDGVSGQFILDPSLFNVMSSLSNYTAIGSLTNSEETFPLLSNFDLQTPVFTFSGDFFFQQKRNDDFTILSFNYTQTDIPFDLACNFKSALFEDGETVEFNGVFFVQHLQDVPFLEDVVVACIDQNTVILDPTAPSFGGSNSILSFVSFGDTTGVANFIQFTNNYGDFFGVGLPFLFVIILAAAFTGRSAPTGILIIAIAIGIMWAMGILDVDPFMWGIILVLVILGLLGGKKFL